jgi:hypothetical protein
VRRLLWQKHLANVPAEEIDVDVDEVLKALEGTTMNGREISNSITTARTLAKSEGSKLKLEYLQAIVQVWSEFEENLQLLQKAEITETSIDGGK